MATDLIEINPSDPSPEAIERAASAVRRGKVVAIPTDALYTLVADPFNLRAVSQVFYAKGREQNRSLPLLVDSTIMVEELSREISNRFYLLARRFWPGALTIILPAAKLPLKVTGNTGRLASSARWMAGSIWSSTADCAVARARAPLTLQNPIGASSRKGPSLKRRLPSA